MINPPPDPDGAEHAELRSEDDGMPVHPEKSSDPVAWAAKKTEREKSAAAGYPTHPIAQAFADIVYIISGIFGHAPPPKTRTLVKVVALSVGMILVANLLDAGTRRKRIARERFQMGW
jgi:hypothetical protein